jgi:fatty acid-binding protein DegV
VRVLNIKPLLNVIEGQITPFGAARSRRGALRRMEQELLKFGSAEMVFVIHARLPEQAADFAQTLAETLDFPVERMMVGELGKVLSCHAGPRVMGAALIQGRV